MKTKKTHSGFNVASTSEDEKYLYLKISDRGKGFDGNAIYYRDLTTNDTAFKPIVKNIGNDNYSIVTNTKTNFLIETNAGAPNGKIIATGIGNPDIEKAKTIIPETAASIKSASTSGGKMFVDYLKDVATRTYVYSFAASF